MLRNSSFHVKASPMSADDYLRNEMSKDNGQNQMPCLKKIIDLFTELHKYEYFNKIEMEREGMAPNTNTIQSLKHMNIKHSEMISQKGNRTKDT